MRACRATFRRYNEFTVVRPIRITTSIVLQPGETVSIDDYRLFQLRKWWVKRRIGVKGSKWVEAMIENKRAGFKPELRKEEAPIVDKKPIAPKKRNKAATGEKGVEKPWEASKKE